MKAQYIEINEIGTKFYCSDKEMKILHREDGPAIEWPNGGGEQWWVNGIYYSKEEFIQQSKKIVINGREFTIGELNSLIETAKKS